MNRVILVGRITKDPEIRYTSNDVAVCQFTLAVNRRFKSNDGTEADFINCVAWRKNAELLGNFVKKGAQIGVEGQIQVRSYEDNGGVKRYVTEVMCDSITFLESKSAREKSGYSGFSDIEQYNFPGDNKQKSSQSHENKDPFTDIDDNYGIDTDNDLPF